MRSNSHVLFSLASLLPLALLAPCFSAGSAAVGQELRAELYQVGAARVDITPDYPIRLSGFGFRRTESEGVTRKIWAKALAVSRGDEPPVVVVTVDNLGVPARIVDELARRLAEKVQLPRERLTVCASHTHTAPMLKNVVPTLFSEPIPAAHQEHIDRYSNEFQNALERVALAALADRKPATLHWGVGSVKFAKNRRNGNGPTDHDLPLLVAREPKSGKPRVIWVNYACHCVTLSNNKISGDWAGLAMESLERDWPDTIALVSIGCGADQNPASGVTGDRVEVAAMQGDEIAVEVRRLLSGFLAPVSGPITAHRQSVELPLADLPTRAEWEAKAQRNDAIGYHARVQLARLDRGEALTSKIDYPIVSWTFGEQLAMAFLPGEVVVDYSLRLKRELDGRRLWVHAYANDCPGYVPSERVRKEGGYEGGAAMVYYDIPVGYAEGLEQKIIEAVRRPLEPAFTSPIDTTRTQGAVPLSAQQSWATLRTKDDLTIDLVAAEPLVVDPVAIDFGPDGRLWIAEMHDYPSGLRGQFEPGGRVRMLRDTNGDGLYDTSTIFLDNLPFPTGITVWRDGVLVCAAPDILYAADTNGDGRADVVRKLYSGFGTGNYQARVNSLCYGLDGWIYGSCGLFGGEIEASGQTRPFALGDRDFRIRPDTGELEPATGRTQQSRVRDDWDNWFGCDNSNLIRHYPLADHYLRRHDRAPPPASGVNVADAPDSHLLIPLQTSAQRFKLSGPANRVTAACGLGIYRDELLGAAATGNSFTCEPVNLVVHRLARQPRQSSFSGRRPSDENDREFLAGADTWFRPVQATTGPDGGLWVVDMCRYVIEHPRWIPPEDLANLDVRAGSTLGRIYRIRPKNQPARRITRLDQLDLPGLVAALDTANGWQRDLATQMIVWKLAPLDAEGHPDPAAQAKLAPQRAGTIERLRAVALTCPRAEARLHALCLLGVLDGLTPDVLQRALADEHPGVRRHAVRLSERFLTDAPPLTATVAKLAEDADAQVRLQVAYSLSPSPDATALRAIIRLAQTQAEDPYLLAAVMSGLTDAGVARVLGELLERSESTQPPEALLAQLVAAVVAVGDDQQLAGIWQRITAPPPDSAATPDTKSSRSRLSLWQWQAIATLLEAQRKRGGALEKITHAADRRAVEELLAAARQDLANSEVPLETRVAATKLLGYQASQGAADLQQLIGLLVPQSPPALQSAAIASLGRFSGDDVPAGVARNWATYTPALHAQLLDLLLSRATWQKSLIDLLEAKTIPVTQIDAARRQRLLAQRDESLKRRVEKLFAAASNDDRRRVVEAYHDVVTLKGDATRGRALFAKSCAGCHRLDEVGHVVGPDLAALANKTPAFFLTEILDPNRNVDSRYLQYLAVGGDGRTYSGLLASESANSITLRGQDGKQFELARADIDQLQATGKSLMPEGLERDLSRQNLADLIALLSTAGVAPKSFTGNKPTVVTVQDQRLALLATTGAIYGQDIAFEEPFRNIGYWHGLQDYVVWSVRLEQAAEFDLVLDYACDNSSAGNAFAFDVGSSTVRGVVKGTGGWDQYRQVKVGTVRVEVGEQRWTMRPDGAALRGALFDLRGVYLVPRGQTVVVTPPMPAAPTGPRDAATLARQLLDDQRPAPQRQAIIDNNADLSAALIAQMVSDLKDDSREEYRRIPWIWRVAIAAGKRNKVDELRAILDVSLPAVDQPLRDWQAVVVGGGLINGVSQAGDWPAARFGIVVGDPTGALGQRWSRALDLAAAMAGQQQVPTGTRYDALRMIPLQGWKQRGEQLAKYLSAETHPELQMGAVSGLADVDAPEATAKLVASLRGLAAANRSLAIDALLRTPERRSALRAALDRGDIKRDQISEAQFQRLAP